MKRFASRAFAACCLGVVALQPALSAPPAAGAARGPLGKPIGCNSAVDGQVSSAAFVEEWTFQGTAGQRVGVNAFSQAGPVSIQLVQGTSLGDVKNDLGRFPGDSGVVAALPQTDTYTVGVFGPAPGRASYAMQYQLALRCATQGTELPPLNSLGGGAAVASPTPRAAAPAPSPTPVPMAMPVGTTGTTDPTAPVVPAAPAPSANGGTLQPIAGSGQVTSTTGVTTTAGVTTTTGVTTTAGVTTTTGVTPTTSVAPVAAGGAVTPTVAVTATTGVTPTAGVTTTAGVTPTTGVGNPAADPGTPPITVSPPEGAPVGWTAADLVVKTTLPFTVGSFIRWEGLYQDVQGSAQNRGIETRQDYLASTEPGRLRVRNTLSVWAPGLQDQKQTDAYDIQIDALTGNIVQGEQFIYTHLPLTLDVAIGKEFDGQGGQWRVSAEKDMAVQGKNLKVWIVTNRDQRDFFQAPTAQGAPANKRFIPKDGIQLYYDQASRMYVGGQTTHVLQSPLGQQIGQSLESHNLAETNIPLGVVPPPLPVPAAQ